MPKHHRYPRMPRGASDRSDLLTEGLAVGVLAHEARLDDVGWIRR
jgi:hypothetical protein